MSTPATSSSSSLSSSSSSPPPRTRFPAVALLLAAAVALVQAQQRYDTIPPGPEKYNSHPSPPSIHHTNPKNGIPGLSGIADTHPSTFAFSVHHHRHCRYTITPTPLSLPPPPLLPQILGFLLSSQRPSIPRSPPLFNVPWCRSSTCCNSPSTGTFHHLLWGFLTHHHRYYRHCHASLPPPTPSRTITTITAASTPDSLDEQARVADERT